MIRFGLILGIFLFLVSAASADIRNTTVRIKAEVEGRSNEGTGFVVGQSREGRSTFLMTAQHVVAGATTIEAFFPFQPFEPVMAEVWAMEDSSDIAVLKITSPSRVEVASLSLGRLDMGTVLQAVVHPGGSQEPRLTQTMASSMEGTRLNLQLSSSGGNSGGPVFFRGLIVAMIAEKRGQFTSAIPVSTLRLFLDSHQIPYSVAMPEGVQPPPERKPTFHAKVAVGVLRQGSFHKDLTSMAQRYLKRHLKGGRTAGLSETFAKQYKDLIDGGELLDRASFLPEDADYLVLVDSSWEPIGGRGPIQNVRIDADLALIHVPVKLELGNLPTCAQTGTGGSEKAAMEQALGRCLDPVIERLNELTRSLP